MKIELVKGFKDYIGKDAEKREAIRKIIVETFEKYGFGPAETPVVEYEDFVQGENASDEAVSDIFKLKDKGKRSLALRYELTFPLKRIVKNKKLPYRRYQIGPVFRDEPVQGNRLRQFTQCDVDIIGSGVKEEAEVLDIVKNLFSELNIPIKIFFGNRKLLNEILDKLEIRKNKEQILREIDKLDKLSEKEVLANLKKLGAEKVLAVLKKPKDFFKKYDSFKEVQEFEKYCKFYKVGVVFKPSLVRGLSYYDGNVFEIKTPKIKETICAGGSYQINNLSATGISFGLDRISALADVGLNKEKTLVVSLNQDREAIKLVQRLREKGKSCLIYYGKPSKALEYANSKEINEVIFVGKEEVSSGKFKIKDMKSGGTRLLRS